MDQPSVEKIIETFLDAWNAQDVDRVAACYTDNLIYLDPNTKGPIRDQESFKRYLKKLLSMWDMTWTSKEALALKQEGGWAFRWHAVIRRPDGKGQVEVDGMDLVILEGDRIARNEVYFDRSPLMALMG